MPIKAEREGTPEFNLRGQELIIDILYWFFLQWEKFVRDYDLKGGEEAE